MKKTGTYALILFVLFLYIVGGNAVTINLTGKISVKISEIASIFLGLALIKQFLNSKFNGSIYWILAWGLFALALILINVAIYQFEMNDIIEAFLYLFRFVYVLLTAFVSARYVAEADLKTDVLKFINVCYIIVCIIGFFQLIFFPVAMDWYAVFYKIGISWSEPDPHVGRLVSTYFDPNYLGSCLLLGIAADVYLLKRSVRNGDFRADGFKYIVCLIIYFVTLLLTQSRSGILGFLLFIFIYALFNTNFKKIRFKGVIGICAIVLIGAYFVFYSDITVFVRIRNAFSDPSAMARFQSWEKGLSTLKNMNFLGLGYNLLGAYNRLVYGDTHIQTSYGNDSSILLVLITGGILGFILFAAHIIALFGHKNVGRELRCVILSALVICNFNNLLFFVVWVFPFYFMAYLFIYSPKEETAKKLPLPENKKMCRENVT